MMLRTLVYTHIEFLRPDLCSTDTTAPKRCSVQWMSRELDERGRGSVAHMWIGGHEFCKHPCYMLKFCFVTISL